jgi:hypothetical protein
MQKIKKSKTKQVSSKPATANAATRNKENIRPAWNSDIYDPDRFKLPVEELVRLV